MVTGENQNLRSFAEDLNSSAGRVADTLQTWVELNWCYHKKRVLGLGGKFLLNPAVCFYVASLPYDGTIIVDAKKDVC